jgi:probable HAF family extracellular repeat protein
MTYEARYRIVAAAVFSQERVSASEAKKEISVTRRLSMTPYSRCFCRALIVVFVAVGACVFAAVTSAFAQTTYTVVDVTPGATQASQGNAINNLGQVTGAFTSNGPTHAFLWSKTTGLIDLGPPDDLSGGNAINDLSQVAGYFVPEFGADYLFLYTDGVIDPTLAEYQGVAYGINGSGQVTGFFYPPIPGLNEFHAFIYSGGLLDINPPGAPPGQSNSVAYGINDSGQVVGVFTNSSGTVVPAVYTPNIGWVPLGTPPPGWSDIAPSAINNSGQVTGHFSTSSGAYHAFLWSASTGFVDLTPPGVLLSAGTAINDSGQVVGWFVYSAYRPPLAFVYSANTGMIDLNALLPNDSGWVLNRAFGINAAGQITGAGYITGGGAHGFLLTPNPLQFVAITPCRLLDTRPDRGGSGPIQGGTSQNFNLQQLAQGKGCADLSSAAAYSLNVAVVPQGPLGYLTLWPAGGNRPGVATLNSLDGRIIANAATVQAGFQGAVSVYVTNTTNVVIDINGYFAPVSGSTLAFYPMTPCRVADTRKSNFPQGLGTPFLSGGAARDFPVLSSTCNVPSKAQAYSLNLSAVPYPGLGHPLGYLEVWPKDQMPANPVSTLNNLTGTVVANAAIVPAGTGGDITVFPSNDTDLVIDINGYFAPAGPGGLSLYPSAPCRVIDTRTIGTGQPFGGLLSPPVDVADSPCAPPSTAQAYVFNATVVPFGALGYLTLWQNDPQDQPAVSTLNALDGWITNNMAIVPTSDGKIDAYASGITQLILDISSYFAP